MSHDLGEPMEWNYLCHSIAKAVAQILWAEVCSDILAEVSANV
jgi:hypothetical protein